MNHFRRSLFFVLMGLCAVYAGGAQAAEANDKPFEPVVGQSGRDVVWVPTPAVLVEKMLDVARVTPNDFVMDLGSGDGRNIIAAAKRGARALGVSLPQTAGAAQLMQACAANGMDQLDHSALVRALELMAKHPVAE